MQHGRSLRVTLLGISIAGSVAGCQEPDQGVYIAATLFGDHAEASDRGTHLLVRAVPDHADGFAPGRQYLGDREYTDECPLDHLEFPLQFALFGNDRLLDGTPPRWRLLAWVTDDVDATWVAPGELYATASFTYWHDPYFGYVAEGVELQLDQVRPE